jgi:hypothetical protein
LVPGRRPSLRCPVAGHTRDCSQLSRDT